MKKLLMVIVVATGSFCGKAQTLQNTIYGLTHFNSILPASTESEPEGKTRNIKINACGVSAGQVCKVGADHNMSCYKTRYAENFQVCKGNAGYFICCENPGVRNSTHPPFVLIVPKENTIAPPDETDYTMQSRDGVSVTEYSGARTESVPPTAPQSQSYISDETINLERRALANTEGRDFIRVCYVGDNVAENSRAPYLGCASPQDDGPDRNRERNENVSNVDANAPLSK